MRDNVRIVAGRFFRPGLDELVVGRNAALAYAGLDLGATCGSAAGTWTVVGIFDAGGSAFDSEIWSDADVLNVNYQRPRGVFQSVTARLASAEAYAAFKDGADGRPAAHVQVDREPDYYEGSRGS